MTRTRNPLSALVASALSLCLACASQRPHVAVFYFGPNDVDAEENVEIIADFSFYMEGITSWLEENDIPYSIHTYNDVAVELSPGKNFALSREELGKDIGFVLIRPDGTYKILYGVHTDVGFIHRASEYFEMESALPLPKEE